MPVFVALILAVAGGLGSPATMALDVFAGLNLGLTIPLVALILGTAPSGRQIDDGTIVYLLVKPVPRRTVVLVRCSSPRLRPPRSRSPRRSSRGSWCWARPSLDLQAGMALGALLASVLYGAVFVTLSVMTGRALVIGLGYVLVWEGLVTSLLARNADPVDPGVRDGGRESVAGIEPGPAGERVWIRSSRWSPRPPCWLVAVLLGVWRLGRFEVSEAG